MKRRVEVSIFFVFHFAVCLLKESRGAFFLLPSAALQILSISLFRLKAKERKKGRKIESERKKEKEAQKRAPKNFKKKKQKNSQLTRKNPIADAQASSRIRMQMCLEKRARTHPTESIAKPQCMKKTR